MKVFVYGTLRKNASNPCDGYGGRHMGRAELTGAVIYDLGWYPGLKFDKEESADAVVHGDVYEINEDILKDLDRYEGCNSRNDSTGLYSRRVVELPVYGETFVYEYNGYPDNRAKVPDGDWLNYVKKGS